MYLFAKNLRLLIYIKKYIIIIYIIYIKCLIYIKYLYKKEEKNKIKNTIPDFIGFLNTAGLGLRDVLIMGVVGSLLRNSLMSLSSPGEFSSSLSLSAELTSDTMVITSLVLESTELFPRPPRSSSLPEARRRLFALLDLFFRGADLIERSPRDI